MQKKILIIDYNQLSLSSLQNLLEGQGYQVITAKDGLEGKSKFYEENPDLVIIEPFLPKLHGFDLIEEISQSFKKQMNLLIMTDFYSEAACQNYTLKYFKNSAFMTKPYREEQLKSKVSELLDQDSKPSLKDIQAQKNLSEKKESEKKRASLSYQGSQMKKNREEEIDSLYEEYLAKKREKIKQTHFIDEKNQEHKIDEMLKNKLAEFSHPVKKQETAVKPSSEKEETAQEMQERVEKDKDSEREEWDQEDKEPKEKPHGEEILIENEPAPPKDIHKQIEDEKVNLFKGYSVKENKKRIPKWIMFSSGIAVLLLVSFLIFAVSKNSQKKQKVSQKFDHQPVSAEKVSSNFEQTPPVIFSKTISEELSDDPQNSTQEIKNKAQLTEKEEPSSSPESSSSSEENQRLAEAPPDFSNEIQENLKESIIPLPPPKFKQNPQPAIEESTNKVLSESPLKKDEPKTTNPESESMTESIPKKKIKTGDIISLNEVDSLPALIKKFEPDYTPAARNFKVSGKVVLVILISESGDVIETKILQGIKNSYGLNEEAEKSVKRWKYKPAVKDGVRVKVWKTVAIVFAEK